MNNLQLSKQEQKEIWEVLQVFGLKKNDQEV
jgi:hypothetical protein